MAYDLILRRETDADWSMDPSGTGRQPPLPVEWSPAERKALLLLEPSTRAHVVDVVGWARSRGIPARLSSVAVIYTPEEAARHYREGRTSIEPGKIGWHHVGRAYHLVILDPRTRQLDRPAYTRVGRYVRSRGGEWLGDKVIVTTRGPVRDLAHFEFHPSWDIASYRRLPLAQAELRRAQSRAAKYG